MFDKFTQRRRDFLRRASQQPSAPSQSRGLSRASQARFSRISNPEFTPNRPDFSTAVEKGDVVVSQLPVVYTPVAFIATDPTGRNGFVIIQTKLFNTFSWKLSTALEEKLAEYLETWEEPTDDEKVEEAWNRSLSGFDFGTPEEQFCWATISHHTGIPVAELFESDDAPNVVESGETYSSVAAALLDILGPKKRIADLEFFATVDGKPTESIELEQMVNQIDSRAKSGERTKLPVLLARHGVPDYGFTFKVKLDESNRPIKNLEHPFYRSQLSDE